MMLTVELYTVVVSISCVREALSPTEGGRDFPSE